MQRLIERIQKDPDNPWTWFELWKLIGLSELPKAAREGFAEYSGKEL